MSLVETIRTLLWIQVGLLMFGAVVFFNGFFLILAAVPLVQLAVLRWLDKRIEEE